MEWLGTSFSIASLYHGSLGVIIRPASNEVPMISVDLGCAVEVDAIISPF